MPVAGGAGGAGGGAAGTSAGASSAAASAAARPLLAGKMDDTKAGSAGAAGKMSAAEKRMLEISAGGGEGGGKGVCECAYMLCVVWVGGRMGVCRNLLSPSFSLAFPSSLLLSLSLCVLSLALQTHMHIFAGTGSGMVKPKKLSLAEQRMQEVQAAKGSAGGKTQGKVSFGGPGAGTNVCSVH